MNKKALLEAVLVFAGIGALDSLYLSYEHYAGTIPPCTVSGCETVLTSSYATLYGVPLAVLGFLFYLSILFTGFLLWKKETSILRTYIALASTGGFLFSLYLFYLQAQVLGAFCQYCLLSLGTSTLVFLTFWISVLKKDRKEPILTS